ncbi:BatD family protein [Marinomonas sp. IMCC 4694]|uniref:BatD family protein n=1 Tax=Marinomonas sp. IMCC 4694 TaxID=2605432 RepID=UPI0011E65E56|nr:BatD family protein [Marinomonas sp. IMCC 4694]TYL47513.1 protein BatD [Marinomonas sp. IMCC 4694]
MVIKHYLLTLLSRNTSFQLRYAVVTFFLCVFLTSPLYAASVTASLSNKVSIENEVIQLTLRADFSDTGDGPDLTPLERDFTILGKSQNSQFSFNLGTSTALNFWVINLMPKSVGTIEIPSIKIGDYQSDPIRILVKSSPQLMDNNGNPPVMIKLEASETEPYLQEQVILSVKLYTSVALQNANRSIPSHPDLVVERLFDDQMSYQTVNGTQYQVVTREYLAFAQRSGTLTVPAQSIQAMINTSTGRRMIKVQSDPLTLQVLPIPASYSNDAWLPSQNVTITTELTKTNDSPRVGDTLIWTITMQADGALPEQIPTIEFNSTRHYKLYPKPPKFDTQKSRSGVIGQQTIIIEVVPTEEGTLTLPPISISYWDTQQSRLNTVTAVTPSINIAPLPIMVKQKTDALDDKVIVDAPLPPQTRSVAPISLAKTQPLKPAEKPTATALIASSNEAPTWSIKQYLVTGLLVLALLMLSLWVRMGWKQRKTEPTRVDDVPTLEQFAPLNTRDETSAFEALIDGCQQNDLQQLRSRLLEWARHRWGDEEIRSVDDIKRLTSVQVTQLLMEAELMMYSQNPTHIWQGEPLADALQEFTSGKEKPSQASQLKTLYPNF